MEKLIKTVSLLLLLFFVGINLANAASLDCSWHDGVNCSAGADWDGSVICYDGWRHSPVSYNDEVSCQNHDYNSDLVFCHTYTYHDKDEMKYWMEIYDEYALRYQNYYSDCLQTLSLTSCDFYYGMQLDIFRECITNAELVPPIDCSKYAFYNFDEKQCECMAGHIYLNGECKPGHDYCRENYGNDYYYNTTLGTCKYSEEAGEIYNKQYCLDRYGRHAVYHKPSLSCRCYERYEIIDDECVERQQLVISPDEAARILGASYSVDNPLELESGWLIKNKEFVETFYVDGNLCLHWVVNEQAAEKHFGAAWNYEGNIKEFDEVPGEHYNFCDNLD